MKASSMLKWYILNQAGAVGDIDSISEDEIDEMYYNMDDELHDETVDKIEDLRCSGVRTDLPEREYSRYLENYEVAKEIAGKWIGWTYWFGGGKHAYPGKIEWIEDAYYVNCKEEVKVVKVFSV